MIYFPCSPVRSGSVWGWSECFAERSGLFVCVGFSDEGFHLPSQPVERRAHGFHSSDQAILLLFPQPLDDFVAVSFVE